MENTNTGYLTLKIWLLWTFKIKYFTFWADNLMISLPTFHLLSTASHIIPFLLSFKLMQRCINGQKAWDWRAQGRAPKTDADTFRKARAKAAIRVSGKFLKASETETFSSREPGKIRSRSQRASWSWAEGALGWPSWEARTAQALGRKGFPWVSKVLPIPFLPQDISLNIFVQISDSPLQSCHFYFVTRHSHTQENRCSLKS